MGVGEGCALEGARGKGRQKGPSGATESELPRPSRRGGKISAASRLPLGCLSAVSRLYLGRIVAEEPEEAVGALAHGHADVDVLVVDEAEVGQRRDEVEVVLDLREDHRVLVPDHIGCGYSSKPAAEDYGYCLADRIDDLDAFLDAMDLDEPVTLVAHDWGGMIAMGWAVRHPDRVAKIVLMNTAAFHLPENMSKPPTLSFVRDTRLAAFLVLRANLFSRGASWLAPRKRLSRRDPACAGPH